MSSLYIHGAPNWTSSAQEARSITRTVAIETLGSPVWTAPPSSAKHPGVRIVTAAVPMEGARPEPFLRMAAAEPRGFWARGDRWVAHVGAVATVDVQPGGSGAGRFRRIRDAAAQWTASGYPRPKGVGGAAFPGKDARLLGRLRFYGGFSFRDDHHPAGFWEAFPPALFILPTLELVGDAGTVARLRARVAIPADADPREAMPRLEDALARAREALRQGASGRSDARIAVERTEMGRVTWEDAVEQALAAIEQGRFSKVVLARTLDLTTEGTIDPVDAVSQLWRQNPGTHVFLFEPRPGRPFLGAAPETVATLRKGVFHATAVAGSIARGESEDAQRELARQLLASFKDREEHRIAREDMVARLGPLAEQVKADSEPHVLTLSRIQHLEADIRARVQGRPVLELLEALHPTPAVCGYPRDAALEFLRGEEPFERGWYAGPVGFFDEEGNGVFAPALRSAVAHGRTWRLFAGAGIVAGSRPDAEWEETRIKFEPVLRALEAAGASVLDPGREGTGP